MRLVLVHPGGMDGNAENAPTKCAGINMIVISEMTAISIKMKNVVSQFVQIFEKTLAQPFVTSYQCIGLVLKIINRSNKVYK
jgi:hypothetical protein